MDSKRLAKETTEQKQTYIYKEKQNKKNPDYCQRGGPWYKFPVLR